MLNYFFKFLLSIFLGLFLSISGFSNQMMPSDSIYDARYIELQNEINNILNDYKGLSAGIALISKDKPDWIVGLGNSDSKKSQPISENTIFRTASISKMFVALAILKLHEGGQLKLEDRIKDIVPEVEFENPWEDTNPIRIVHLLEHTTGWDESHLVERMHNHNSPISLKNALEFHPHSRKSRWVPGSRMSYSNSGFSVAAYIVEKTSGIPYEKFVYENILKPLKMNHSTFFNDSLYQKWGAPTFNWAMKKVDYKNELYRPSAAMNSSPKDMAQILKLLLYRGSIDSLNLFDEKSILRMEVTQSTSGAQEGLELGYGLGNFTTVYNGFVYHGHDGAMDGGLSQLAYLPEHGIGHLLLLNANNAEAMQRLIKLIRDFETKNLLVPELLKNKYDGINTIEDGFYLTVNPRNQNLFYQDVLFAGIEKIEIQKNTVSRSWLFPGPSIVYHQVSPNQFTLGSTNKIGLVIATDPLMGKVLYSEDSVLMPISSFKVFGQLSLFGLWIVMIFAGFFTFIILSILNLLKGEKYKMAFKINVFPTITSFFIILTFFLRYYGFENADLLFSTPNLLSVSLLFSSIFFVVGTVFSLITIYKTRRYKIQKRVFYPVITLSFLHLFMSFHLVYYGFIPLITWA
jgi:CubicO group peptidase (beta-lactamase class C family)